MTPSPPADLDTLLPRLLLSAPLYFPDLDGPFEIELLRTRSLSTSWIHELSFNTPSASRRMVVKVRGASVRHREGKWAQLVPLPPRADRAQCEHDTMRAIHEHFDPLPDDRFGAVPVYDVMPEMSAIVMGHASNPSLEELVSARGTADLLPAFRNAGAWLREFHGLRPLAHTVDHDLDTRAIARSVERSTEFLASQIGAARFFRGLCNRFCSLASNVLSDPLEHKIAHADFWLGNVLVDESARVTVIDTIGAWRGPIYNDLSYFLYTLDSPLLPFRRRLGIHGLKIAQCRAEFLAGYFGGDTVPHAAIALFELRLLLQLWARTVATARYPGAGRLRYRAKLVGKNPLYRRAARQRLDYAESVVEGATQGAPQSPT
jgi:aminoglycoside phosphotransferase (APT) family kinase protein